MGSERTYLKRADAPGHDTDTAVRDAVASIIESVRDGGDDAVRSYTKRFDGVDRDALAVTQEEIDEAAAQLTADERAAIDRTIANVRRYHEEQREHLEGFEVEVEPGITLGQRVLPIASAGVYIPGGRHPLVASPAMAIVPAVVAGVERIVACAPPQSDGVLHPSQLYAMVEAGADEIYCIGGAQAIAAMAYGTESVPASDIVTGPGNIYTTEAKRQVYGDVGIDFLAGPTEVLIIADETADPSLVSTDLLAQAEHDPNARAMLVSTSDTLARDVIDEVAQQLPMLDTEEVARESWDENGEVVVVDSPETAAEVSDAYAMEHVQVMTSEPRALMEQLHNYGSLFLGPHAPVVFGDKVVGTNHILPTREVARYQGGIWVGTYLKTVTHQELDAAGAATLAPWAARICSMEGTHAHRLSAEARSDASDR